MAEVLDDGIVRREFRKEFQVEPKIRECFVKGISIIVVVDKYLDGDRLDHFSVGTFVCKPDRCISPTSEFLLECVFVDPDIGEVEFLIPTLHIAILYSK